MADDTSIPHPILKVASVGLAWLGGMTWGDLASALAAIYTLCLIVEWVWKRLAKPLAIRQGWIDPASRHFLDSTVKGEL